MPGLRVGNAAAVLRQALIACLEGSGCIRSLSFANSLFAIKWFSWLWFLNGGFEYDFGLKEQCGKRFVPGRLTQHPCIRIHCACAALARVILINMNDEAGVMLDTTGVAKHGPLAFPILFNDVISAHAFYR